VLIFLALYIGSKEITASRPASPAKLRPFVNPPEARAGMDSPLFPPNFVLKVPTLSKSNLNGAASVLNKPLKIFLTTLTIFFQASPHLRVNTLTTESIIFVKIPLEK
jgi:hypothetical protein